MNSIFLLIYNRPSYGFDQKNFHDKLVNHTAIRNWWHYLTHGYIFITSLGQTALRDHVHQIIPNESFLIVPITLESCYGYLTKDAWDWINKNSETYHWQ